MFLHGRLLISCTDTILVLNIYGLSHKNLHLICTFWNVYQWPSFFSYQVYYFLYFLSVRWVCIIVNVQVTQYSFDSCGTNSYYTILYNIYIYIYIYLSFFLSLPSFRNLFPQLKGKYNKEQRKRKHVDYTFIKDTWTREFYCIPLIYSFTSPSLDIMNVLTKAGLGKKNWFSLRMATTNSLKKRLIKLAHVLFNVGDLYYTGQRLEVMDVYWLLSTHSGSMLNCWDGRRHLDMVSCT